MAHALGPPWLATVVGLALWGEKPPNLVCALRPGTVPPGAPTFLSASSPRCPMPTGMSVLLAGEVGTHSSIDRAYRTPYPDTGC